MYLATIPHNGRLLYVVRSSFFDEAVAAYDFRDVFELGVDPRRYIHRIAENAIYFDEALEGAVARELGGEPTAVLEELLWDFLPPEEQRIIGSFRRKSSARLTQLSTWEQKEIERTVHLFDRRRLYYIRYGAVDQSRIYRLNDKLYRPLLQKSRDEKEYYFQALEKSLRAGEMKKYIFVIFNLQQSFDEIYRAFMPEALNRQKMDEVFVDELCRLNSDAGFWQKSTPADSLHFHLRHYLISYFDSGFESRSFDYEFYREFRAGHRRFTWPEKKVKVSEEEVTLLYGRTMKDLKKMSRAELGRLFRKKAKDHHPDGGGEADDFIKLRQVYENLKRRVV